MLIIYVRGRILNKLPVGIGVPLIDKNTTIWNKHVKPARIRILARVGNPMRASIRDVLPI